MKQAFFLCVFAAFFLSAATSRAVVLVSGFNAPAYTDGTLLDPGAATTGQNGWGKFTGTGSNTNPLTITSGVLRMNTTGQDAYRNLGATYTDTTLFYGGTISVLSAQAAGQVVFGFSTADNLPTAGGRILMQSSGAGYVLGGSVGTTNLFGSTVLNFNQSYRFVLSYTTSTTGTESLRLYVDPTDTSVEGNNTAYLTQTGNGLNSLLDIVLNQGTSLASPVLDLSYFAVGTAFTDVAVAVPEPSTVALLISSACGLVLVISRRKRLA